MCCPNYHVLPCVRVRSFCTFPRRGLPFHRTLASLSYGHNRMRLGIWPSPVWLGDIFVRNTLGIGC